MRTLACQRRAAHLLSAAQHKVPWPREVEAGLGAAHEERSLQLAATRVSNEEAKV